MSCRPKISITAGSIGTSTSPAAFIRSATSKVSSRGTSGRGRWKNRLNASGRFPRPMAYMSRKPAVVISAVLAPLFSSTVLMAMVEPWRSSSIAATSQPAKRNACAAPSVGSAGAVEHFGVTVAACWEPPRAVKVPPMSIPTMLKTLSSESHRDELVVVNRFRLRHGAEDSELLERMPDDVDRRRVPGAVDREARDLRVVNFGGDAGLDLDGL